MKIHSHFLTKNTGEPLFLKAETAWGALHKLQLPDFERLLDARKSLGFNAIHLQIVDREIGGSANFHGEEPFHNDDFSRPLEPYWRYADQFVEAITSREMIPVLATQWWGPGGWLPFLTPQNCTDFGRFLGERYAHLHDVLWIHAGDRSPYGGEQILARNLARALQNVAPNGLHTVHNGHEQPSAFWYHDDSDWLGINAAYTYDYAYKQVLAERGRSESPVYLIETGYEAEASGGRTDEAVYSPFYLRRQAWGAFLAGASGHAIGHHQIWQFKDDWMGALEAPGARSMQFLHELADELAWPTMKSDHENRIVRNSPRFGSKWYVSAAIGEDFFAAYLPQIQDLQLDGASVPFRDGFWLRAENGERTGARFDGEIVKAPRGWNGDAVLILR